MLNMMTRSQYTCYLEVLSLNTSDINFKLYSFNSLWYWIDFFKEKKITDEEKKNRSSRAIFIYIQKKKNKNKKKTKTTCTYKMAINAILITKIRIFGVYFTIIHQETD